MTGRALVPLLGALIAGAAALSNGPLPAAVAAGTPIGPNQLFAGFVNHHRPSATINMACVGPIRPGQTGHPFGNQSLSVEPSVDTAGGFTGSKANRIEAVFVTSSGAVTPGVTFHRYGTKALPTPLTLPCSGTGEVSFVPLPSSSTARPDNVQVTFVGQP